MLETFFGSSYTPHHTAACPDRQKNDFFSFGNKVIESGYVNNEQMRQAVSEAAN